MFRHYLTRGVVGLARESAQGCISIAERSRKLGALQTVDGKQRARAQVAGIGCAGVTGQGTPGRFRSPRLNGHTARPSVVAQ